MALVEQIAPRPAMIVAARDDDRVPGGAQQGFIDAERHDHVTLIWTSGKHIGPGREAELAELFISAGVTRGEAMQVSKTDHAKCGRCWRLLPEVSEDGALCDRCEDVVAQMDAVG